MNSGRAKLKSENESFFYNAAAQTLQSDYRKLSHIFEREGSWEAAWYDLREKSRIDPQKEWGKLEEQSVAVVMRGEPFYPPLLEEIPWPPFGLYVKGDPKNLCAPALAVVGTRKATASGRRAARDIARNLAEARLTIVSGLALGIDGAAHEGALDAAGKTVGVLATGLDQLYPRHNELLAKKIIARGGALVSEYPIGSPALPHRFLERNRIVSGLALGVLVVEAPERSGSLATARFAVEQNRHVFVLPGPVYHPNFAGSHALIRNGAELITAPAHILETLGIVPVPQVPRSTPTEDREQGGEERVLVALAAAGGPVEIDKIAEATKLDAQAINQALAFLIVKNKIREEGGGYLLS
jgi:DNA processing protein